MIETKRPRFTCPYCNGKGGKPGFRSNIVGHFEIGWHGCYGCGSSGTVSGGYMKRHEELLELQEKLKVNR